MHGTLLAAIGIVILLWTVVVLATVTEHRTAIDGARVEASNLSAAFAEQVRQVLRTAVGTMDLLEQRMRIEGSRFDLAEWAQEIPELAAPMIQGSIIDPNGKLVASTLDREPNPIIGSFMSPGGKLVASTHERAPPPLDLSDRPHFRIHIDDPHYGIFISKPVLGRVSKRMTIQVSKRLEDKAGNFAGVMVFSLDPERLTTLHSDVDLGPGGIIVLAGTDGIIRARFGRMSPDGKEGLGDSLEGTPFLTMMSGAPSATYIASSKIDGVERLFSRRSVEGYRLMVSVGLALDGVFATPNRHAMMLATLSGVATFILLGYAGILCVQIRRRADYEANLATANEELADSKTKAESASHAKSMFMANMSHELRTPLNAIIGLSQVMCDQLLGTLPKRYGSYAADIKGSGEHLLGIINDILDISRIEAGKIELNEQTFDLSALVRRSLSSVSPQAVARDITLALDGRSELPGIRGDEARLRQVMLNLLSNAIKFTPDHGSVSICAALEADGRLSLSVTDTGIGMAPHEIEIAFERFRQVDDTYTKRYGGSGLGLPISKELVAMHGGLIEIMSAPGEGTTVHVRLPADRVVRQDARGPASRVA